MDDDFFNRSLRPAIKFHEGILSSYRWLIEDKGTTTDAVQALLDKSLDVLSGLYKLRRLHS